MKPEVARLSAELNASLEEGGTSLRSSEGTIGASTVPVSVPPSPWPDPTSVSTFYRDGTQFYKTPDGEYGRTTAILKVAGMGVEGLIKWSANSERAAVLEVCGDLVASGAPGSPSDFMSAIETRLGKARSHQKLLAKAGDIGSEIHKRIQWHLHRELGLKVGHEPALSMPAAVAFSSWRAWWIGSGLVPIRVEQPVWDPVWGYAGTIDLIARAPDGVLEIWDWKSASGIYDVHHMQLAGYTRAASRWRVVRPGKIVWLPKTAGGSLEVVAHELGHLYDGRTLSLANFSKASRHV